MNRSKYQKMQLTGTITESESIRWTENIFSLQSHLVNKFNIARSEVCQAFEIPDELDTFD